jgi:protein required for attachment to host cells
MEMDTCVVVLDATRARFLVLKPTNTPDTESGPNLVEVKDLINPESDERGRDLWSDTKTGVMREGGKGEAHSYDDHRDAHEDEFERRFAKRVVEETKLFVGAQKVKTLVIAAAKKMMGFLRPYLERELKKSVTIHEVTEDLTKFNVIELQQHLAKHGSLPRRNPPRLPPRIRTAPNTT